MQWCHRVEMLQGILHDAEQVVIWLRERGWVDVGEACNDIYCGTTKPTPRDTSHSHYVERSLSRLNLVEHLPLTLRSVSYIKEQHSFQAEHVSLLLVWNISLSLFLRPACFPFHDKTSDS